MALIKIRNIVIVWIGMFFFGCKSQGDSAAPFSKDIPLAKDSTPIRAYIYKEQVVKKLRLDYLEAGFDSLQLRVWYSPSSTDSFQLLEIKCVDGQWSGTTGFFATHLTEDSQSIDWINGERIKNKPVSGWPAFVKKVFDLEIMTLPDVNKLDTKVAIGHSGGVALEVATKSGYRFYHYYDPEVFDGKVPEAQKMDEIIALINREFSLDWFL